MAESRLVFVSYTHDDRPRVEILVERLEGKLRPIGAALFWDPKLPVGAPISDSVQKLLREAACVIVVWSVNSVSSQWVHGECEKARVDGRLVPIKIDPVANIPPPFNALKHGELFDWDGEETPAFDEIWKRIRGLVEHGAQAGRMWDTLAENTWAVDDAAVASRELRQLVRHFRSINEVLVSGSPAVQDLRESFKQVADTYKAVTEAVQQFFGTALKPGSIEGSPYVDMAYGNLPSRIEEGRGHCGQILVNYRRVGGVRDQIAGSLSQEQLQQVDNTFEYLGTADGDAFARMTQIGDYLQDESRAIVNLLYQHQEYDARARIIATQKLLQPLHEELTLAMREMIQLGASLGYVS